MPVRSAVVPVLLALSLAACNGDDDASSTTAATVDVTTTSGTSVPDDTTTAPTTTTVTTTVATTTSAPPTTTEPPPTSSAPTSQPPVDDAVQARLDVVEAVGESFQVSLDARRKPFDDSSLDALEQYYTGNQLAGWQRIVERFRAENLRLLVNPEQADTAEVELASLALNGALDSATVQVCEVLAGVLVEVGGNDDGSDRVIADSVERTVVELEVVFEGGRWKVSSAREPEPEERIARCE